MPQPRPGRTPCLTVVLCALLAPAAGGTQTIEPASARDAAGHLLAPHFGGPGDATVDYLGQLLARTIATSPADAVPLDPLGMRSSTRAVAVRVDYERVRFRTFGGAELRTGDLTSFTGGLARAPTTHVTTGDISADVTTFLAAAALSPRLALTFRAPIVRLGISGERQAIEDRGTPSEAPAAPPARVADSSFSGLGDITTAAGWRLLARDRLRVDLLAGIRWPTGDADDLLGAGELVPEAGVLVSLTGAAALRLDLGVSFANGHGTTMGEFTATPFSGPIVANARPLDTWTFGAAAHWTPHRRVALDGDLAFRTMLEAVDYDRAAVRSASALQRAMRLVPRPAAVTDGFAGATVLVNVGGPAFVTAGVTAPLGRARGLQAGVTPRVGLQVGR